MTEAAETAESRTGTRGGSAADRERETVVEAALGRLGLDAKTRLLAGQDMWSLPGLPEIGLRSLVMSDGPIGVRGVRWTADDPSIALPSPTALAATWDPALAHRAGVLLAQEARRKHVHVLLAPTVNLHRSPLGGRHFEAYSEDPYLTGRIGAGYVRGVQSGGVGTTVKHFVANDAETDRFTVDNLVSARALRELYLAPFEAIVENAHPWGIMTAYNSVNGTTMTEHHHLVNEVLRGEWGFDGFNVSDWTAARSTVGAIEGGLDVAMPGPETVYGDALAAAVRAGRTEEAKVDEAVRNVLRLAARVGILEGAEPVVTELPEPVDGEALAREIARRSFVLVRNENATLPLRPGTVAVSGAAARDARVLGGGSATVFPAHVVSPLDGLTAALPEGSLTYAVGADPNEELAVADKGFTLRAECRDRNGELIGSGSAPNGHLQWMGNDLPEGVTHDTLHTVDLRGTFTPRVSGTHVLGIKGLGAFTLTVDGTVHFEGTQLPTEDSPFTAFFGAPEERARVDLTAGETYEVSLRQVVVQPEGAPLRMVGFSLVHQEPRRDPDELIAEAVEAARAADTAVVVVATTERVESEGFDRGDLRLPGRQDDLVHAVAAANPNTVVIVNSGSPVELTVARGGRRRAAHLVPRPGGRQRPRGRPHGRPRARPAAHDLGSARRRPGHPGGARRRRTPIHRGRLHRLPGLGEERQDPRVPLRARPRLHRLGVRVDRTFRRRRRRRRRQRQRQRRDGHGPRPQLRRAPRPRGRPALSDAGRGGQRAPGPQARRLRRSRGGSGRDRRGRARHPPPRLRGLGRGCRHVGVCEGFVRGCRRPLDHRPPGRGDD